MKRKLASVLVIVMTFVSMTLSVFAKEIEETPDELVFSEKKGQEEIEAELEEYFEELTIQLQKRDSKLRGPQYVYKYEYLPDKYTTVSGFAGNQLRDGYRFPTGGGFYFSNSGGPSVSASVAVSLPAPYNVVSFSINMGQKSSAGTWVVAPNKTNYFKLYVSKDICVRPYTVYRKHSGAQYTTWEVDHYGATPVEVGCSAYAKAVK